MKFIKKVKEILVNFKKTITVNSKAVVRTIFASLVTLVALAGGIALIVLPLFTGALIVGVIVVLLSLINLIGIKGSYSNVALLVEQETAVKAQKNKVKAFAKADKSKNNSRDATVRYRNRQDKNKIDLD